MDYFETVNKRRSIRRFRSDPVPEAVIRNALQAAVLAPNSSNAQTWDFYWLRNAHKKAQLIDACLSQSAARTAQELIVATADPHSWKRSWPYLKRYVDDIQAPPAVHKYYNKLFPWLYRSGFLNLIGLGKALTFFLIGWFKPIMRGPSSHSGVLEVCVKSCALACQNFVLAITAQGFSTCMMEGFDEKRIKKILKLKSGQRVVMVIAVGKEDPKGVWGPRFRLPLDLVFHEIK